MKWCSKSGRKGISVDSQEKKIIDALSEPAKRMFWLLDKNVKRRVLNQAKVLTRQRLRKDRQKGREKRLSVGKQENKKKDSKRGSISAKRDTASSISNVSDRTQTLMIGTLQVLLLGQGESENSYGTKHTSEADETSESLQSYSHYSSHLARSTASRFSRYARMNLQRQRAKRQMRKTAEKATKQGAKATAQGIKKSAEAMSKVLSSVIRSIASNPVVWIALLIVLVIGIIVGVIAMIVGSGGAANSTDNSTYQAQVSEQTEGYRELVEQYCEKYGIDDYVDLCLAVIEQESGGNPPDVMQTAQSYYNTNPPIDNAEESIDCGTHELSDCLTKAECKDSTDIPAISLALQGYNFGNGYIDWAVENYKGYSKDNAELFSIKMCDELGYESYGDSEYVPHVLRYYVANPDTSVSNESAKTILVELKDNNDASDLVWKVIEKGASLIGVVQYSMEKRESDGRDNPIFLDCSAFTAWAFHKAGNTGIPYSSNTSTFISSSKFVDIEAKDLQPGDIGLKSKTAGTGGANHVGIYCGTLKNGTKIWMHCTSSSGSSLTGNDSGAMFGAYTNFTYFRRLKKWNK